MAKDDYRQELKRLKEEVRLLKRLKCLREVERQLKEMPQKGVGVVAIVPSSLIIFQRLAAPVHFI
jgi:hypothetical protein